MPQQQLLQQEQGSPSQFVVQSDRGSGDWSGMMKSFEILTLASSLFIFSICFRGQVRGTERVQTGLRWKRKLTHMRTQTLTYTRTARFHCDKFLCLCTHAPHRFY
jgi:hypothetical protein